MKLSEDGKTWTVSGTNKDTGEDSTLHIAYARAGATDYDYAMLVNECGSSCKRASPLCVAFVRAVTAALLFPLC